MTFIRFVLTVSVLVAAGWTSSPAHAANATVAPQPQSSMEQETPDWQARLELAQLLAYSQRYEEALTEYDTVLTEQPGNLDALLGKAQVLSWMGDSEAAAAILENVPRENLEGADLMLLAETAIAREDFPLAEELIREYLSANPGDHRARLKLAQVLSWTKRYEESLAEYETILKALPDDKQIARNYAQVLSWAGRTDEAIEMLQKTLD